jgi:hypothetical protein
MDKLPLVLTVVVAPYACDAPRDSLEEPTPEKPVEPRTTPGTPPARPASERDAGWHGAQ